MGSLKFHLLLALVLFAHTIIPAFSDDYSDDNHGNDDEIDHPSTFDEDGLILGLNNNRQSLKLASIAKNAQAECIADEVTDFQLVDQHCGASADQLFEKPIPAGSGEPFPNYQDVLTKCNVNANQVNGWFILPVCVPKLDPKVVLGKYTQTPYGKLVNDPKYTGIGVDSVDNWVVVVLSSGPAPPQGNGTATPPANSAPGTVPTPAHAAHGAIPPASAATPQGSAAAPQPSAGAPHTANAAAGMVSQMGPGAYLMTLLLSVGLLLMS